LGQQGSDGPKIAIRGARNVSRERGEVAGLIELAGRDSAGQQRGVIGAGEEIALEDNLLGTVRRVNEAAGRIVRNDRVVHQGQCVCAPCQTFSAKRDGGRIVRLLAFVKQVAPEDDDPTVRRIYQVARGSSGLVSEVAGLDVSLLRPALQVVTNLCLMEVACADIETADVPDVSVVRIAVTETIACKLRAFDRDRRIPRPT